MSLVGVVNIEDVSIYIGGRTGKGTPPRLKKNQICISKKTVKITRQYLHGFLFSIFNRIDGLLNRLVYGVICYTSF